MMNVKVMLFICLDHSVYIDSVCTKLPWLILIILLFQDMTESSSFKSSYEGAKNGFGGSMSSASLRSGSALLIAFLYASRWLIRLMYL